MAITENGIIGKDARRILTEKRLCLHLGKNTHQADNMGSPEIRDKQ